MTKIKSLLNFVEYYFLSIWGLTILDIMPLVNLDIFDNIDDTIKTAMALFGAIFFLAQLPFKIMELVDKKKLRQIEIEHKAEELERLRRENDLADDDTNN